MKNVKQIVHNDLCSGCGVCGGICPVSAIEMVFNHAGEYNPRISDTCTNCGLCLKVCPFSAVSSNEDAIADKQFKNIAGIHYQKETGYYKDCFAGFSPEYRATSASGGLLSFTLQRLFQTGAINKVICVIPNPDPEKLFRFTVINSVEQLLPASGSAYYPVEMSEVIKEIIKTPADYAIVGLPCYIKALRNAAGINPVLKERVKFCLGLTCGQNKSKYYTTYLAQKAGLNEPLKAVKFRGKDLTRPPCIIHEFVSLSDSRAQIDWEGGVSKVFTSHMFALRACLFCDDTFAECSDAAFMDAWHPKYSMAIGGTSFVLSRSIALSDILANLDFVKPECVTNIISSQSSVVKLKHDYLSYRLYLANRLGEPVPSKRVSPSAKLNLFNRHEVEIKAAVRVLSKELSKTMLNNAVVGVEKIDIALASLFGRQLFWSAIQKKLAIFIGMGGIVSMGYKNNLNRLQDILEKLCTLYSLTGCSLIVWWQIIYMNKFRNKTVSKGFMNLILTRNCVVSISNSARVILNARCILGWKQFGNSKMETRVLIGQEGSLVINGSTTIYCGSDIRVFPNAVLTFNGGFCNDGVQITCGKSITIGKNCAIARDVIIRDYDAHQLQDSKHEISKEICIGDNVWIGTRAIILKGVTIGSGAIVAAGAVVSRDVPPNCMVAGVPAKVIRENVSWK